MQAIRLRTLAAVLLLVSAGSADLPGADSCASIRTFADGRQPLREIFVAATGSDTAGNGARTNPYQTLTRAVQGIRPGDAVRLLPGTYQGGALIGNVSGTPNAPIWLGGVPGLERPVIRGGAGALHLSRVRYLVLENLEIAGARANGINCDDAGDYGNPDATRYVIFRNLGLHQIGTGGNHDALKLSGVNDFLVLDCQFSRSSAGGSGIDQVGCHRGVIARCVFTELGGNALQCKGGSDDIEIRSNRFLDGGGRAINIGGSTGFEYFRPPLSKSRPNFEARNIRVVANLFRGADAPVVFVGTVDSLVAHNTIVGPRRWIVRILQETVSNGGFTFLPCGNNQFINNLIAFDRTQIGTPVNIDPNTAGASFQFAHNLWHTSGQPAQSRPDLPSAEANGVYGLDPLFRDAAGGDFSIPASSPATAKGKALPNVRADLLGNCYSDPPAIGAFEAPGNPKSE